MRRKPNRYCRTCGALAPEQGRFCASCGASLNLTTPFPRAPLDDRALPAGLSSPMAPASTVITPSVSGSVRMGFGIALGMVLFFALVLVVLVIAVGLATSTITWPFAQQGQRFEGVGPSDSAPLALEGAYVVEWTATPTSPSACNLRASLLSQRNPGAEIYLANSPIEAAREPIAGRVTITVAAAPYTIHVESGCSWSLRFTHP